MFAFLLSLALAVLLRPGDVLAAHGPTSVGCGEAEDVILRDPPRPIVVPRCQGADVEDGSNALAGGQGEPCDPCLLGGAAVCSLALCAGAASELRTRDHWRPPTRGPPAV